MAKKQEFMEPDSLNEEEMKSWEEEDEEIFSEETSDNSVSDPVTEILISIGSIPMMTEERFLECYEKYHETKDPYYRNQMVEANMRLVASIAKRYKNTNMPFNDRVQEGMLGLITAAERFDLSFGCTFSTYATWWIRQSIVRSIQNTDDMIRIPVHSSEKIRKMRKLSGKFNMKWGRDPEEKELLAMMNISKEEYEYLLSLPSCGTSLDQEVYDGEGDADTTLLDYIAVSDDPGPEDIFLSSELRDVLLAYIAHLPERQQKIIDLRFGLTDGEMQTLNKVAKNFHVSPERIRGLQAEALRRLRRMQGLKEYVIT